MAFSLASARKAATQHGTRYTRPPRQNSLYAQHRQAIITLHFTDHWPAIAIARQMQADEPLLKKVTTTAVESAVCRILRKERTRRTTAPT